ncbi:MAG TPA: LLM class flavin-dependent oxidoreductase [Halobacteriales archaeon]|jgi:probable F420-dependent oxidoreductase|nr:LLM class flavin-dependent oxidoreductase [Halobacteriales archaeon]|tara:strand:- start:1029 stop:2015 length:987 start_codon:yes stop_codon:yes gene_type:complete
MGKVSYGLLLPHFGEHASASSLIEGAKRAEELEFDSVWVRDHFLRFHGHGFEGSSATMVEPFVVLAGLAAATKKLKLGTAVAVPWRHPLYMAHLFASLDWLSEGRVIAGMGAGATLFKDEFELVGLGLDDRVDAVREAVEIMRLAWENDEITYDGRLFPVEGLGIAPRPKREIPIWYGGSTPASARRAVEYCDGWFPGRITIPTFRVRMRQLRELSEESGKDMPTVGVVPPTSPDTTREKALEPVNVEGLLNAANNQRWWLKPKSGKFENLEDLEGVIMAGTPEDIAQEVGKFIEAGVDHIVFDLRFRLHDYDYCMDLIGEEVLPLLK